MSSSTSNEAGSSKQIPEATHKKFEQYDRKLWLRENASLALVLSCLAIIVSVIAAYEGKQLPQWPASITINSLISTVAAILKPALAFLLVRCLDEIQWRLQSNGKPKSQLKGFEAATRGPWGAILLLFKHFGTLASLGAVISILNVAVDPFIQQMLQYYDCTVPVSTNGIYLARSNYYDGAQWQNAGSASFHSTAPTDHRIQLAALLGFLSPPTNATSSIAFYCPSGNCTFGEPGELSFTSLAMCYEVNDLASHIRNTSIVNPLTSSNESAWSLPTLSGNASLTVAVAGSSIAAAPYNIAYSESDGRNHALAFELLMLSASGSSAVAFGVSAYPCIQQYKDVAIVDGILRQTILSTTPLQYVPTSDARDTYFSLAGNFPSAPGVDCTSSTAQGGTKTAKAVSGSDGTHSTYIPDGEPIPSSLANTSVVYYDPRCTYLFAESALQTLSHTTTTLFGTRDVENSNGDDITPWLDGAAGSNGTPSIDTVRLWMDGVANALTATIRQNLNDFNNGTDAYASGVMLGNTTCIRVQWTWIALPATVVGLSLTLLYATMLAIRHSGCGRKPFDKETAEEWNTMTDSFKDTGTDLEHSAVEEAAEKAGSYIMTKGFVDEVIKAVT